MLLGAHMSIKGGLHVAIERAKSIGCTALQLFTANARSWTTKPLSEDEVAKFREMAQDFGKSAIISHDGYLINLASPKEDIWEKSKKSFAQEIKRCDILGIELLVMHPGAGLDSPRDVAISKVATSFNSIFKENPDAKVKVLIENTAGQGSALGYKFQEIADIINQLDEPERFGVCLDTCHSFAAGYDLSNKKGYDKILKEFDDLIGVEKLMAFHLNDAKKELGSRVDRHEQIGKGELGLEAFRLLLNDSRFKKIPMSLETPKGEDLAEDIENLKILRSLVGKKSI